MATSSWIVGTIGSICCLGALACADPTATADPHPGCPTDAFVNVVAADSGWRALIQAQAASVRPDTLLEAAIGYRDSVTVGDRTVLQAAGVEVTYEFAGTPALSIRLTAGQLALLTAPEGPLLDSRVVFAEIGRVVCIAAAWRERLPSQV